MVVKIEISDHIIVGVRKNMKAHIFSPETMKIGHINKQVRSLPCAL